MIVRFYYVPITIKVVAYLVILTYVYFLVVLYTIAGIRSLNHNKSYRGIYFHYESSVLDSVIRIYGTPAHVTCIAYAYAGRYRRVTVQPTGDINVHDKPVGT